MREAGILLAGYKRAARFLIPYRGRLVVILLTGVAASLFGLAQPYMSKLLIDQALLRKDFQWKRKRVRVDRALA